MTAALDLAARGLGDTVSLASLLTARGYTRRLGTVGVRPADRRELRVHHAPRRQPHPGGPRVHGACRAPRAGAGVELDRNGGRDCCRRGVPADDLLAAGGGPADDRRQRGPGDAALGADGARDGGPAGARRVHHARRRQVDLVHVGRARARRGDRPPPPPDRALPDRRAEDPVGRRPRGGRAARARDVAGAGGAHAGRDRRGEDVPARASDPRPRRHPDRGRPARRHRARGEGEDPALRERGRGPAAPVQARGPRARPRRHRVRRRRRAHHGRLRRRRPARSRARWPRPCP